jgi:hypothetical protein
MLRRCREGSNRPSRNRQQVHAFRNCVRRGGGNGNHRGENRFCGNTLIDELICEEYGGFFSRTFTRATNGGADVMGAILESPFLSSILLVFYIVILVLAASILTHMAE